MRRCPTPEQRERAIESFIAHQPWKIIFVRFGDIPKRSKNHRDKTDETGVSVYEAIVRAGTVQLILPTLVTRGLVSLSGVNERPMFQVEGTEVGTGSDGEPLLFPCKKVRKIELSEYLREP